ncbi:MAG TPA: hypothetical protein VGE97_08990 [Nitrososphaera sp.]|jgi:hypothetical protein
MKFRDDKGNEHFLPDINMWVNNLSPIEKKKVLAGHIGVSSCRNLWKWFGFTTPAPRSLTPIPEKGEHAEEN